MALLMEIGDVKSQESIINLFDNPFLAYVADVVWNELDPLLQSGATIRFKSFEKLRADVDKRFDHLLTSGLTQEERNNALKDYDVYLPDMVAEGKKREEEQQAKIMRLEQENSRLKKSLIDARSAKARTVKKKPQSHSKKKNRKN